MSSRSKCLSAAFKTEVAVIGAGVVGLAIARSLAMAGKEVLILDRASTICSETSSRNSEVIHAGLYYPQSSLKAKFCVEGKRQLYHFCQTHNIPYNNCGKIIVATTREQYDKNLPLLQQKAINNGVFDTKIISKQDVTFLEPEVESFGALLSPSTGVIDSHSFFLGLLGDAENHGAVLSLHTSVEDAEIVVNNNNNNNGDGNQIYLYADDTWIHCDAVVNSAGLWAPQIASIIHNNIQNESIQKNNKNKKKSTSSSASLLSWEPPVHYFAKGTYFRLQGAGKPPFSRLVYPIPEEPGGLGVHATIDWSGQSVKFGPDVEWLDIPDDNPINPDDISLNPDASRGEKFYDAVRKYWPNLPNDKLVPDYVGIRPKLVHPSRPRAASAPSASAVAGDEASFVDFQIVGPKVHGIKGLIHLFGIESPGLTSSMAIGDYVRDLLTE